MAVPLCLRCRWFPAAAPRPWSHWSHPASRSCKKCLRPPTRARRAPPTDPPFSLRAPRRCACGPVPPSTCRVLGRAANVTTSPRSGSLASSTIRRPSPRRLWSPRNGGCPSAPEARRSPPRGLPARGFAGRGRGRCPCGRRVPRTRTRRRVPAAARPAASRVARPYAARRGNEWRPERLERFPAAERARHLVAGVPEPIRPCHLRDREGGGVLLTARPLATCCYGVRPDGPRIIINVRRRGGSSRACAPGPPAGRAAAGRDMPAGGRTDHGPRRIAPARQSGRPESVRAEELVLSVPASRSVRVLINATPIHFLDGFESPVVTMPAQSLPLPGRNALPPETRPFSVLPPGAVHLKGAGYRGAISECA